MLAPDFRHALTQQYSLNIQTEFARNFLLEVGYVGARATHLNRGVSPNQALLASPSNPIRGVTTNTVGNVAQRVRIQGFQPGGMSYVDSNGSSWYNSMQTSITKRMSHGLQFLTSYTWSKNLGTEGAKDFRGARGGTTPGDQIDARQRYGPSELSRAHRFVFSYIYEFPNTAKQNTLIGKLAAGWSVSGVATFQTGSPLSILLTSGNNVYGITNDRAQLAAGCTHADLVTSGQVQQKLNNYFNAKCFTTPPVIGDDARATAFGNSGVGIVNGPAQQNIDMSIIKKIPLPSERTRMEFRAEFFNLFNTPQFADPATNLSSSTFGQISSTSVNPRFVQLALKLSF
jgi:hypothetical protein